MECRPPRIAVRLSDHRIDPRVGDGAILRHSGDVRPAASGLDDAERAGIGRCWPPAALDHRGLYHHGHQRHAPGFRDTPEVLSEHLFPNENVAAARRWFECVDLSLTRLPETRRP